MLTRLAWTEVSLVDRKTYDGLTDFESDVLITFVPWNVLVGNVVTRLVLSNFDAETVVFKPKLLVLIALCSLRHRINQFKIAVLKHSTPNSFRHLI